MANIEDLRDRSVSSGTLKSDDLIPKFLGVLKTYGKDKYDKYIKENPEVEDWENLDEETMGWVVDELTDLLNEIAPDGCYFGASEGDGADFGFWSVSQDERMKKEGLSIDDWDKYNMDHYAAKAAGWTWDDDNECYRDKDGIEVEWDSSDAVMIDPIEYDGHTYGQVNVWGDGTVEFQDETGESTNWADFDDELVGKIYATLGGKVGEARKSEKKDDYALFFETLVPGELTGARMFLTDMWNKMGNKKPRITFESEDPDFDSFVSHPTARVYVCGDTRSIASYAKYLLAHYDEIPQDFKGRWVWKNDLAYFARGFKESLEANKSEGNDDDKGCKGKDCKDDKTKKNEADATFKVGDFVNYDAESDGKADLLNPMVYAEVSSVNDDGTLDLCVRDFDDGGKEVKGADTQFCDKLDHFAGMTDTDHYYMDGRLNLYAGYYEIFITDKELGKPYVFSGTIDDLSEKDAVDIYYDTISFVDKSLEDECRDWAWFDEDDPEGSKVIDMSDMVNPVESKQTEDVGNAIQQFASEHGKDTDKSLAKDFQAAVESVIGDNGKVIDAWVDAPLRNTHSTAWNASIVSDDMEADGREVSVTLYTTFDGKSYLVCEFWDKDSNIIDSVKGDYGDFDLLPMFKKCIGVSESKKSEVVSDTDPDDMKVGKFAVTLLADDDEYVGSVPGFYDDEVSAENAAKDYLKKNGSVIKSVGSVPTKIRIWTVVKDDFGSNLPKDVKVVNITADESKKSESLTLKQKELKDMARFGQAEDITTISDEEAKALRKKGIETIGVSRGTYGMNGALLRDNEGKKYVITARSSNLFYFV